MGNKNSGLRPNPPKYICGDQIVDDKRNFTILGSHREPKMCGERIKNKLFYHIKCNTCGAEFDIESNNLLGRGDKCPCCSGKRAFKGINDLNTVRPDLTKYLLNKEDGTLYTQFSNKKIKVKCPDCGYVREVTVSYLSSHKFSCPQCSDGISYPNKFVRCMLSQLNINFIHEYYEEWTDGKFYDQYLPDYNMIIENHGMQHYEVKENSIFNHNVYENDIYKMQLAIQNGIKYYIQLDCRYSEREYLKDSIMNSDLPNLLQFSEYDVDWKYCDYMANKSLLIQCVEMYNSGKSNTEIAQALRIDMSTVSKYVKKGYDLDLITIVRNNSKNGRSKYLDKTLKEIQEYISCHDQNYTYADIAKYYNHNQYVYKSAIIQLINNGLLEYDIDKDNQILKERSLSNLEKRPQKMKVYVYTKELQYVCSYNSAYDAEIESGGKYTAKGIQKVCSGNQKTHRNMIFSYTEL